MENIHDVFEHEIQDLYSAESQLLKALPKLAKAATHDELRQAFLQHLDETETHVKRLEQIGEMCEVRIKGTKCKGMEGLISEGSGLLENGKNAARDAAMIPAAQRVEHYEIAAYGSALAFAKQLDFQEAAELLQQTLDEEKASDAKLSEIASEVVNPAAQGPEKSKSTR